MKVETRLIWAAVCAVAFFLYEWLYKGSIDWYPPVVAFALIYFVAPYVFTKQFFLGNRELKKKKKDASSENNE